MVSLSPSEEMSAQYLASDHDHFSSASFPIDYLLIIIPFNII
jgi:hypothetical protein